MKKKLNNSRIHGQKSEYRFIILQTRLAIHCSVFLTLHYMQVPKVAKSSISASTKPIPAAVAAAVTNICFFCQALTQRPLNEAPHKLKYIFWFAWKIPIFINIHYVMHRPFTRLSVRLYLAGVDSDPWRQLHKDDDDRNTGYNRYRWTQRRLLYRTMRWEEDTDQCPYSAMVIDHSSGQWRTTHSAHSARGVIQRLTCAYTDW